MPRLVSEISSGQSFQFSAKEGQATAAQTRRFKVLLNQPGEAFDIQRECGVFVGDFHPLNTDLVCNNYEAQFDGESRMALICSFSYEATSSAAASSGSGQDPKSYNPEIRPANWSTSSSLIEVPVMTWHRVSSKDGALGALQGDKGPAVNPAGDMVEGLTRPEAIVTISIDHWESEDPTKHVLAAGKTNDREWKIGSLICPRRTVMFRGLQAKPAVESWRGYLYRGWMATYEFVYKPNYVSAGIFYDAGVEQGEHAIGWDIAVPLTGFNVKAFDPQNPNPAGADDVYGQPLKHTDDGKIQTPPIGPLALFPTVSPGDKVRGMVRVFSYQGGGASQTPSAMPIPLNVDGRPRDTKAMEAQGFPPVLIRRYKVTEEINFNATFKLRLF